ncbi:MAG TPA: FAD-dependent oxidoreductase [Acidimicrobiales bacterium]|nr:FAD-dependent oxidoreductase [Acidimicrobiales bacterium]HWI04471.1 FAD-dependent oxidoreductase [Acidimicrobiales bacterium]
MGSLNETNPSLWVGTSAVTRFHELHGDLSADVVVVGAGIAGLTTAALLKADGARVVVIEAGRVASGVTGYTTAKLTVLHGLVFDDLAQAFGDEAARKYADANLAGMATVADLAARHQLDCELERRPAYTYTTDPEMAEKVRAEVGAAQRLGLDAQFTTDTDLPYPVEGAIRLADQAQFHPRKFCIGLARAVDGAGCAVYEGTRALSVDEQDGSCTVETDHGTVTAGFVVQATHLPFSDSGGFFARAHPVRSYALSARLDGPVPQGMYLSVDTPSRSVRSAHMGDEEVVILGGESHKVGQDPDTRERYAALESWARAEFPVRSVDYRWSAQDFVPVDHVPFVGPVSPASERVLVATGFKKWGMSNGSAAGVMLADRIAGRQNPFADFFDTNRANPRQSIKELVKENANVVKRFVSDRLQTETRSVADLAPGEAAVLVEGTERVAVYRDEAGAVHAVSPVCTHMGCTVTWNTAETTWDCPCHGSRFTCDGAVIQGPAVKDLERKDVQA